MEEMMNDKEKEVASILLELPKLLEKSEKIEKEKENPLPSWSVKRKGCTDIPRHSPSPDSVEEKPLAVGSVTSPTTPLVFDPSESDDKNNSNYKRLKTSATKSKEELTKTLEDLSQNNALLREELDKLKHYCDELRIKNSSLQTRLHELNNRRLESSQAETEAEVSTTGTTEDKPSCSASWLVNDQIDNKPTKEKVDFYNYQSMKIDHNLTSMTTLRDFNHNSSAVPQDKKYFDWVRAKEARYRRKQILKDKKV